MEVQFELEAVTPIFIAGADQRSIGKEGLRAPSLKGLLRWWFRAIMGGMVPLRDLRLLEGSVFGDTSRKSLVKIKSVARTDPSEISIPNSLRYLWFSIYMQKRHNQRLQCYSPGNRFEIVMRSDDEKVLEIVSGCLWAVVYLGGIGSRMRRGAGSLKITKEPGNTFCDFVFGGKNVEDAKEFVETNLQKILNAFKEYAGEKYNPPRNPNFPVLSEGYAKLSLIEQPFDRWDKVLEHISNVYQQFRRRKRLQHRYTFGLPIISHRDLKNLRQASPIMIGIMDLNGKYTARINKFYTSIHPHFSTKMGFLSQDLDNFDDIIERSMELGEIKIKIPRVS
ncbi:MAG: type III-B CRISPR module RAMP protein Cmr1 [Candidatus Freyarchaeota archaeon]